MKKSFSLLELIFVILIVSVLSIGAVNSIPDNALLNSTNYIEAKILDKRANALAYEVNLSSVGDDRDSHLVCIKFDKDWLKDDEKTAKVKVPLSNKVTLNADDSICFDFLGRPHSDKIDLDTYNSLNHTYRDVNISYNGEYKIIRIYPISGFVEIRK